MWISLTDPDGQRVDVNLDQAAIMQRFNDQTTITMGFTGRERTVSVYVRETPDEIYGLARTSKHL